MRNPSRRPGLARHRAGLVSHNLTAISVIVFAQCVSPPIVNAQASQAPPNEGFYHKGTRPACDQTELTRLKKDVAALQQQARDLQADKRAAELKLFDLKSRMYGWHGSIWRFTNALIKAGVDWAEPGAPKAVASFLNTLGLASDIFGATQAVGSGLETGPSVETGLNALGQAAHACATRQSCWERFTEVDGAGLGLAIYEKSQKIFPPEAGPGQSSPEQWAALDNERYDLTREYAEAAESNASQLNKGISAALLVMNALELQNDLQDAAELQEEIDRLQQRWNTIDAAIEADLDKITPLVAACSGNGSGAVPSPGRSHSQSPQASVELATILPNVDLAALSRWLERWSAPTLQRENDDQNQVPYRAILLDLKEVIAKLEDARTRLDWKAMPALAPFFAGTWQAMNRRVVLDPLRTAGPDIVLIIADLRSARDGSQRVARALGTNANLGTIYGDRVAVTPITLGSEISFADASNQRHLVSLRSIGTDQRRAWLEVQSTPQSVDLVVGDSATVALDRMGIRRVRVTLEAAYPFGVALVALRALPPHLLVDLDAATLALVALVLAVGVGAFLLGYTRRTRRGAGTSHAQQPR